MFNKGSFEILILSLVLVLLQQFVGTFGTSCVGKHQIPSNRSNFNIFPRNMSNLECIRFSRDPLTATLENNGQTIVIRYTYQNEVPVIAKGQLGADQYRFEFMHFNWLNDERVADNDDEKAATVELHLIFSNTRYDNFQRAATKNLGIAIMSFKHTVFQLNYNTGLYDALADIRYPNEKTLTDEAPALFNVIEMSYVYYVYLGKSAITQPTPGLCGADVVWLDFPTPIEITPAELQNIRDLMSFNGVPLMSQIDLSMPPNTTIYSSINRYIYEENGWSAETFEGFGVVADSSADWKNGKLFIVIIVMLLTIRLFGAI